MTYTLNRDNRFSVSPLDRQLDIHTIRCHKYLDLMLNSKKNVEIMRLKFAFAKFCD